MSSPQTSTRKLPLHGAALLLACSLLAQAAFVRSWQRDWQSEHSIGRPPDHHSLSLLSLGESRAASYAMMLYLQSFDAQAGQTLAIRSLDMKATLEWLESAMAHAPAQAYPLYLAARIYAEAAPLNERGAILDFVHRHFTAAPNERWPWLAHAAYIARHELHDSDRARRYARSLREQATGAEVPRWVRDMEFFVLAEANQAEAARILLGALIESGQVTDARDIELMSRRISELTKSQQSGPEASQRARDR